MLAPEDQIVKDSKSKIFVRHSFRWRRLFPSPRAIPVLLVARREKSPEARGRNHEQFRRRPIAECLLINQSSPMTVLTSQTLFIDPEFGEEKAQEVR